MSYEDEHEFVSGEEEFVKSLPPHLKFIDYIYVTAGWEWAVVVILQDSDGMFHIGTDSGCSCNGPLEYGTVYSEQNYTGPLTFNQVVEAVALNAADGLFETADLGHIARDLFDVAIKAGAVGEPGDATERYTGREAIRSVLKSVIDEARQNEEEEEDY